MHVVVWWDRPIGPLAAGYMRRMLWAEPEQGLAAVTLVPCRQETPELWADVLPGRTARRYEETSAGVWPVVQGLAASLEPDDVIVVLRGDVLLSAAWWPGVLGALAAGASHVGPVGSRLGGAQRLELDDKGETGDAGFARRAAAAAGQFGGRIARVDHLGDEAVAFRAGLLQADPTLDGLAWGWVVRALTARATLRGPARPFVLPGVWAEPEGRDLHRPEDHAGRLGFYAAMEGDRLDATGAAWCVAILVSPQNGHQLQLVGETVASVPPHLAVRVFLVGSCAPWAEAAEFVRAATEGARIGALRRYLSACRSDAHLPGSVGVDVEPAPPGATVGAVEAACSARLSDEYAWAIWLREGHTLDDAWTPEALARLASHPDPSVYAYNVQVLHSLGGGLAWVDEPASDGGDGTGANGNEWLICRTGLPRLGVTSGGRVSALRVISRGLEDPRYRRPWTRSTLRVEPIRETSPIAVGMLAYSGEDPGAVLRWIDDLWALAPVTVGWTEPTRAPAVWCAPVPVVPVSMDCDPNGSPDLGEFRAELALRLHEQSGDNAWIVQIDPDESAPDPVAFALALRRMAGSGRRAFLWQFDNSRPDGKASRSAVVRAYHASVAGLLTWVGVVHETLQGVEKLTETWGPEAIGTFPVVVRNLGTPDVERAATKLAKYRALLQVEIARRPQRAQPWVLLGYQYASDGHWEEAIRCYAVAERLAPQAFMATYERGMLLVQLGAQALAGALPRIPVAHFHRPGALAVVSALQGLDLPPLPAHGPTSAPDPLPPLPTFPEK